MKFSQWPPNLTFRARAPQYPIRSSLNVKSASNNVPIRVPSPTLVIKSISPSMSRYVNRPIKASLLPAPSMNLFVKSKPPQYSALKRPIYNHSPALKITSVSSTSSPKSTQIRFQTPPPISKPINEFVYEKVNVPVSVQHLLWKHNMQLINILYYFTETSRSNKN